MPRHDRTCPVCNLVYSVTDAQLRCGNKTTCSKGCSYKFRVRSRITKAPYFCPVCGVEFLASLWRVTRAEGRVFCSIACQVVGRKRDPAKLAAHGCRTYIDRMVLVPPHEFAIADRFKAAGIDFVHQWAIIASGRACAVDFYLPDLNAVIEVDKPDRHNRARHKPRDRFVDGYCNRHGIAMHRILDDGDPDAVFARIKVALGI